MESSVQKFEILKGEHTGSDDFGKWRKGKNHDTFLLRQKTMV